METNRFNNERSNNDEHLHEIVPNLYLGNMYASHPMVLYQHGIDCVLNLGGHEVDLNKNQYRLYAHAVVTVDDVPQNAKRMLDEIIPYGVKFIDNAMNDRKRILVHCAAGVSRSSTVVIAWLMKTYNMDRDQAYLMVKQSRNIVRPNDGFMQALQSYQMRLKRTTALRSVMRGATAGGGRSYCIVNDSTNNDSTNNGSTNNGSPYKGSHQIQNLRIKNNRMENNQIENHRIKNNRIKNNQLMTFDANQSNFKSMPEVSYFREYAEKMHNNHDDFKHIY